MGVNDFFEDLSSLIVPTSDYEEMQDMIESDKEKNKKKPMKKSQYRLSSTDSLSKKNLK